MLEKLLSEIRAGGTFETGALAARLGTTPELVMTMLEHLQRAGFIQPYQVCSNGCDGCSLRNECHPPQPDAKKGNSLRLFTLAASHCNVHPRERSDL